MRQVAIVAVAIMLAGCAEPWTPPPAPAATAPYSLTAADIKVIEAAVRYNMKDPSSTTFRNIAAVQKADGSIAVCGEANSRNSFGGYGGFMPFSGYLKNERLGGMSIAHDADSTAFIAKNCAIIGAYR